MNIAEILERRAHAQPNQAAIIDNHRGRSRTTGFGELNEAAARLATRLHRHGLKQGDTVLVLQPMSAELYTVLSALFRLGLVAMFLDPSTGREHMERCCRRHPPRALIASPKAHLLRLLSPALRRIPLAFSTGAWVPGAKRIASAEKLPQAPAVELPDSAPALLTFTSGSTGEPKAAVRSHGFLMAQHRTLEAGLALQSGEVDLSTLPIFVLANLASGVTSLIPNVDLRSPGRINARRLLLDIQRHQPSRSGASPAFFQRLVEHCRATATTLPALKKIYTGGAPVFPDLLERLQQVAPAARVTAVYGSTEAEPIAHVAHEEISPAEITAMVGGRGLLAGTPVPEIELRILPERWGTPLEPFTREAFEAQCLPAGEPGEIVVSGEHVLPGYLQGLGDAETKFEVDGRRWHRTGDSGYLDERGRLWLLGRSSARIQDAKGILYPFAVECAARQLPAVTACALLELNGERLLAVEMKSTLDLAELRYRLTWARLDRVVLLDRIPMDRRHNAKVDYPMLRQRLINVASQGRQAKPA
ncbi:AMP-dependent synthetase [Alkalilimnicola ehrlichii]|uniref:AMP-dependent synthetase n=1 Tax=Alkalilimnicola ehrlichii TaxID=351052 RepID=A0A3E0WIA5_9GAMM|nr:AMP-binding protein [Alkalilimnicola ehrlichii]RFA25574.1 AMP-dependent synthetase [Alkalilimnicola ehrlichii]RFA32702.1 AMP-dependent synthetase [Alkalilimnicola ehrlichii]